MPKFQDIITFSGGADTDSGPRVIAKGDWRELSYCRLGAVQGQDFCVVTSRGTIEVPNNILTPSDTILGVAYWNNRNAIVYFVESTPTDQIWVYFIDSGTHELVVSDGVFDFDVNFPIYHADVVDDILKWTDGRWDDAMYDSFGNRLFNPPFQINLQKALDGEYVGINLQTVDAIKWPLPSPSVAYVTDATNQDNKLRNKLFKFRIQAIYENNEEAVFSHYSNLALPSGSEFVAGTNWSDPLINNAIDVTFFTGPNVVKRINIAVQQFSGETSGSENPFGIFRQYTKALDGSEDNTFVTVRFFGDEAEKQVPLGDRNYDRLPIEAYGQCVSPSKQIVYLNFREGYDKIELDVTTEGVLTEVPWQTSSPVLEAEYVGSPSFSFNFQWEDGSSFVVSSGMTFSTIAEVTSTTPDFAAQLTYTLTDEDIANALIEVTPAEQMYYILGVIVDNYVLQLNEFAALDFVATGNPMTGVYSVTYSGVPLIGTIDSPIKQNRLTGAAPTLKTGANHQFGIVYFDRAERDGTILTDDSMKLFVPFPVDTDTDFFDVSSNPFRVNPKFTIDHIPPVWATHYRFAYRDITGIQDFSQLTIIDIVSDEDRYKLSLQNLYQTVNNGATINHVPQKGDILRFIRKPLDNVLNASPSPYVDYFELEVMEYSPDEGILGTPCVWVNKFNIQEVYEILSTDAGQLVEIYTPRPVLDDKGELFVGQWRIISDGYEIANAHTATRAHSFTTVPYYITQGDIGDNFIILNGWLNQFEYLVGSFATVTNSFGETETFEITAVGQGDPFVIKIDFDAPLTIDVSGGTVFFQTEQVVSSGVSVQPCIAYHLWGNVYLRQRNMDSSYPSPQEFFYWIEDPHYSDYWLSKVIENGEFQLESPYARMTHRLSTLIHSETYVVDSQINGLSSFSFNLDNILDLDQQYGEIYGVEIDGKTIKALQPRKENSVYVQGAYSVTTDGEPAQYANSTKTFASWRPYMSLYGCMDAGSVVIVPSIGTAYWDRISGSFILSATNGQLNLSEKLKYRTKSQQIKNLFNNGEVKVRSYVNEEEKEVGWCFSYNEETEFLIVTLNYEKMRFSSTYDYNFRFFGNIGEVLVGFGVNNQLYLHNQDSLTFHGDDIVQKIVFVSNTSPMLMKRYQNIKELADKTFSVRAYAEPNQSYSAMETVMGTNLLSVYEGYSMTEYRKNRFSAGFSSEDLAMMEGEDMRANALTHELEYRATENNSTSILFSVDITGVLS